MRQLTDAKTERLFEKLASYMGHNIKHLIDRPDDPHVFRLQRERVYYVQESITKLTTSVARDKLLSISTYLSKFTLPITALDHTATHAQQKVWVKANGERPYLYGDHIVKAHVGRMSEDTPEHQDAMIYAMNHTALEPLSRSSSLSTAHCPTAFLFAGILPEGVRRKSAVNSGCADIGSNGHSGDQIG